MKNPIKKNIIANIYGVGINTLYQIALVPVFLTCWGTYKYGDWIILSAIAYFFNISDAGVNSVTANLFAYAYVKKDYNQCNKLITNNFLLVAALAIVFLLGILVLSFCVNIKKMFNLISFSESEAEVSFLLLSTMIFVGMLSQVFNAIYRANSDTARGVFYDNTTILFEVIILVVCLLIDCSLIMTVLLYVMPKFALLCFKAIDTHRLYDYKYTLVRYDGALMKQTLVPALSFLCMPIGHAILNQGFTIVVSTFFGPVALVAFNTMRTLTNSVKKAMGCIITAVWPEMSLAFANHNLRKMRSLHRKSFYYTFLLTLLISVALLFLGEELYVIWTKGNIDFSLTLMSCFLSVLLVGNLWAPSSVVLMATNQHKKQGFLYVLMTIIVLVGVSFASPYMNLYGVVLTLLIVDFVMLFYAFPKALKITADRFVHFFSIT